MEWVKLSKKYCLPVSAKIEPAWQLLLVAIGLVVVPAPVVFGYLETGAAFPVLLAQSFVLSWNGRRIWLMRDVQRLTIRSSGEAWLIYSERQQIPAKLVTGVRLFNRIVLVVRKGLTEYPVVISKRSNPEQFHRLGLCIREL